MRTHILALGLGVGAALVLTGAAQAQSGNNCAQHDSIVAQLAAKYGETRQSVGLAENNQMVEVFASQETGSWTIIVTRASGVACMVAAGQNFEVVNEDLTPAKLGEPA